MYGVILETTDRQNYNLITSVISDKAHDAKHSAKVLQAKVERYYTSCCHNYNEMIVFSKGVTSPAMSAGSKRDRLCSFYFHFYALWMA